MLVDSAERPHLVLQFLAKFSFDTEHVPVAARLGKTVQNNCKSMIEIYICKCVHNRPIERFSDAHRSRLLDLMDILSVL